MRKEDELINNLKIFAALTNFEQEYKQKKHNNQCKNRLNGDNVKKSTIIATVITLIMGCSAVLATSYIFYPKIWKEPKSYTYDEYMDNIETSEITEKEQATLITEEQATQKAIEILERLGYENQTIDRIELNRGSTDNVKAYYIIKTKWEYQEGLMVQLNAENGEFVSFRDMELSDRHLQSDELSDDKISNIATQIYNRLEINDNIYKVYETKIQEINSKSQTSKMLEANLCKYYGDVKNPLESCKILFIAIDDEIFLNSITFNIDSSYQDNPIIISKEEAINIAINKEKEFSSYEITNVTCELSIEKMNTRIYEIERGEFYQSNEEDEQKFYETENLVRKVWKVKLEHDIDFVKYMSEYTEEIHKIDDDELAEDYIKSVMDNYTKEGMDKFYYVDVTTGEIIGGMQSKFD